MVSPSQKRRAVQGVVKAGLCSQRRACRYLGVHRSSHRHTPKQPSDWLLRLHAQIETLSHQHPRLGYRKLVRLLRKGGWQVGRKLVQRIRREHGLRVRRWMKRPRRRGQSTGPIPTRAQRVNHVWTWDFLSDRTDNGGKLRILSIRDEHTRECLALHVARQLTARGSDRGHKRAGCPARGTCSPPQRQRQRVRRSCPARLVSRSAHQNPLHRTRQSVAERACRELPRLAARRVLGSRAHAQRGRSSRGHRGLPALLQRRATPRWPRLPHTRASV